MLQQLLDNIRRYLNGRCTLQDLESWLLSSLQRILDSGDEAAIQMANQIDADFVELGEGLIDELTLLGRLNRHLSLGETISFVMAEAEPSEITRATTTVETVSYQTEIIGPVADHRFSHVFA